MEGQEERVDDMAAPMVPDDKQNAEDEFRPSRHGVRLWGQPFSEVIFLDRERGSGTHGSDPTRPNQSPRDKYYVKRCSSKSPGSAQHHHIQRKTHPPNSTFRLHSSRTQHKTLASDPELTPDRRIHSIDSPSFNGRGSSVISPSKPSGPGSRRQTKHLRWVSRAVSFWAFQGG